MTKDNQSSSLFNRDNNASAFNSSGSLFNRGKVFQPSKSLAEDNPFKARDKPSSLFKTESKLFPSSSRTNNNFLFPQRKEGTSSIFQKTGSTYGTESPKKFSSSTLFTRKDNNNPFSTSASSTWGKASTKPTSIFQSKTTGISSPTKPNTSSLFQSKTTVGITSPLQKKETTGSPFLNKANPPYINTYSLSQGAEEPKTDAITDQKQKDALQVMTSLIKYPFERERNKEMLKQFKQSYEKSQAIKQKEIENILRNPYQIPKYAATLSSHRTAPAPSQVLRSFPTSYL